MQKLQPKPELYHKIIDGISYEKQLLKLKRKLFFHGAILVGLCWAFVLYLISVWQQIAQSDFFQLLNLVFTDIRIISNNFSDYILSLVEAMPIISFGILASIFLLVLFSTIKILRAAAAIKTLKSH